MVAAKKKGSKAGSAKKAVKAKAPAAKKPSHSMAKAKKPVKTVRTAARAKAGSDEYMSYSGKFTVRLPRSLHQALVARAEKEGVSLNLFVTNALSRTVATPGKR